MALRRSRLLVPTLALTALTACERAKNAPPAESTVVGTAGATPTPASPSAAPWDRSAGTVLLIAGDSPTQATLILPDSGQAPTIPNPASVTLIGRGGTVQTADLQAPSDSLACRPGTLGAAPPPKPWSVGFLGGVVAPLGMDSLSAMSPADSAQAVAMAARLASALPNDSLGRFAGLPFTVRELWRFTVPSGPSVFAATLVRQINQEASPLEERTFLLAERDSAATGDYKTVYWERSHGNEETVESREVLAAALLGSARNPTIILSRDFGNASAYSFVQREADGRWHPRWTSPRRHC